MAKSAQEFVAGLAADFPALLAVFAEHRKDNLGETLPNLLMADYCRVLLSSDPSLTWVEAFLSTLEEHLSGTVDDPISNVIAVTFIEHLPPPAEPSMIVAMLGEKMQRHYEIVFGLIAGYSSR